VQSWGTADSGVVWSGTGDRYDVAGGAGILHCPAGSERNFTHINLPTYDIANQFTCESLMKFEIGSSVAWPLTDVGPLLAWNNTTKTGYYMAIQGNYSEVSIGVFINGNRSELARKATYITKDEPMWVRFKITTSGIMGKIWKANGPEPTGWTISTLLWNASNAPQAGSCGIFRVGTRDTYDFNVSSFYFYTSEDAETTGDVQDTFGRTIQNGWGISSGGHVWQGNISDDPEYYSSGAQGSVSGGDGHIPLDNTVARYGFLGPSRSGNVEGLMEFTVGSASGEALVSMFLRATRSKSAGQALVSSGYRITYFSDSNILGIYRRDSTSSLTTLETDTITTIPEGVKASMRVQIIGTTIQARCWESSLAEPVSWQVTTTDPTYTSGVFAIGVSQSTSVTRNVTFDLVQQTAPTISNVNALTTGGNGTAATSTTITITSNYTGDANDNSTASLRYKPTTTNAWVSIPAPHATNRTLKNFTFNITGLLPATSYHIEVTYQDADGIQGANPRLTVVPTASTALQSKSLSITETTSTSISIEAIYELDTDNTSTANAQTRIVSTEALVVEDYFVDEKDGTYLQNAESQLGGTWSKHSAMTSTIHAVRRGMYYYSNALVASDKLLYVHSATTPTQEYDVIGTFLQNQVHGNVGICGRVQSAETYYGAGIGASTWELFKVEAGVKTVLATAPFDGELGVIGQFRLVIRDAYKAFMLNGVELMRTTDNTINSNGLSGYYATNITEGSSINQFTLGSFLVSHRTVAGSWVDHGAMTADRPNKKFTKTLTGLLDDNVYEIMVTFTDEDGTIGSNPLVMTAQIVGKGSSLLLMGSSSSETSAVVSIFYEGDSNNNSFVDFQYRSSMDNVWTTVPFSKFRTDRTIHRFDVTLTALVPNTTYLVKATLNDPDGIVEGGVSTMIATLSTKGVVTEQVKQSKHYLWKVYNPNDEYLGTIWDAPEPSFDIEENGGVTNLQLTLTRKMSEAYPRSIIGFQNRVDIWALDPSSNGMGPNLMEDPDCDPEIGGWVLDGTTYGYNADYDPIGGPDGGSAVSIVESTNEQYETASSPITASEGIPLVLTCMARARGAKLRVSLRAFDINDESLETSDFAETVGIDWQTLSLEFIPPVNTSYIRVILRNTGKGTMKADKFTLLSKESMVYRGRVESFTPRINDDGEEIDLEVLGLSSLLSDDYIDFLQFVESQPQKDVDAGRLNFGAKDPADMLKKIIDEAKRVNPFFTLYYTNESIRSTGILMQYTFRNQQVRSCFDKVRNLCPSGWHYYIEPDGLVVLRGPEHAPTHTLHIGREIQDFEVEKSIRDLKNFIHVQGRQDEDESEPDGYGSIEYIAFDQASIDKYGKRTLFIRDSQLVDPESAKIVGDGRLDENNREQQRATCMIPDEKGFYVQSGPLRGYNIESFRAGDNVIIVDPIAGARNTYWNQFRWDEDVWDSTNVFMPLPEAVPIKTVRYRGDHVELELSERPPSAVGAFAIWNRWANNKDREE
jgi:hypothetical protein